MALTDPAHALDVLAQNLDDGDLSFDNSGLCQITVQDVFVLNLQKVDARRLRLVTYLDGLVQAMSARFLLNAATANQDGSAGLYSRFGLHKRAGVLCLEELLDVTILDADALEARVLTFTKTAAYWLANADNLFDDENPLEPLVHHTGSGMDDAEFQAYAEFADDMSVIVKA